MSLSSGGWCAPSEMTYLIVDFGVEPERWPRGLLPDDIDWIARMLTVTEINVDETLYLDMPTVAVRRGGIRFEPSGS